MPSNNVSMRCSLSSEIRYSKLAAQGVTLSSYAANYGRYSLHTGCKIDVIDRPADGLRLVL